MKHYYSLFLLLISFTSCNGQVKTMPTDGVRASKTITAGQPKIVKTQGSGPADNVHCGLLDNAGNLWFGTTGEGVYRYDGISFTNFTTNNGLSSNSVWSILEDKSGSIWFGTDSGLSRYDGKSIASIPITVIGDNNPSAKNAVWSILQDKSGKLWFGTTDGVYCYNGVSFTYFLDNDRIINTKGLHLKMVEALLEDTKGNIWFASWGREGMCYFDGKSLTNSYPNGDIMFKRILEDKNGGFWLASRPNNIYHYDGKTVTNFTGKDGLRGITDIVKDKAGNIWFSGDEKGGLWRFDGKSFTKFTTNDGLGQYGIWCIVEDRAGNLWLGTRNTGLYRYDGKSFTNFSE